ncbi:MAG: coiled-coil domain-containing protein [Planctomycetota bacterium]
MLIGPFEYAATLVLAVDVAPGNLEALQPYRSELLECAWTRLTPVGSRQRADWQVAADAQAGTLSVEILVDDPAQGAETLVTLAATYLSRLRASAEAALAEGSDGERILRERLDRLRSTLSRATRQERDLRAALPTHNPILRRNATREELAQRRRDLSAQQHQLVIALRGLDDMKTGRPAQHPSIDQKARERAVRADVELQQDLEALRVRLTAVRTHLLDVWQQAAPILDELIAAGGDLQQLGAVEVAGTGPQRADLERAVEAGGDYHRPLTTFAETWTKEFVALQQAKVDPAAARVLEVAERLPRTLGDFLYAASATLTDIRDRVRSVNEEPDGQARHHVLIARLTRAFHALQNAHHRFEFAASMVRATNNFRLAAALESADGLRRRTLRRMQLLELQLTEEARREAARARENAIADLEAEILEFRSAGQASVDAVLGLQDRIEGVTPVADQYTSSTATADTLAKRIGDLSTEIDRTERQLTDLVAARRAPVDPEAVSPAKPEVNPTPVNLSRRVAYGWAAGVSSFLILLLIQRFVPRRRK